MMTLVILEDKTSVTFNPQYLIIIPILGAVLISFNTVLIYAIRCEQAATIWLCCFMLIVLTLIGIVSTITWLKLPFQDQTISIYWSFILLEPIIKVIFSILEMNLIELKLYHDFNFRLQHIDSWIESSYGWFDIDVEVEKHVKLFIFASINTNNSATLWLSKPLWHWNCLIVWHQIIALAWTDGCLKSTNWYTFKLITRSNRIPMIKWDAM